jgi:hypothetical protein
VTPPIIISQVPDDEVRIVELHVGGVAEKRPPKPRCRTAPGPEQEGIGVQIDLRAPEAPSILTRRLSSAP